MKSKLDHRKIVEDCLTKSTSEITPIALWRHFPVDDMEVGNFVRSIANFQDQYDFDIIKVTPASSYSTYDWGTVDEWRGNPEGSRENRTPIVRKPNDWLKLRTLDVRNGFLGRQIQALRMLREIYDERTPIIQTVFSPLSQAKHLAGNEVLLDHINNYPDKLLAGLQVIKNATEDFLIACQKEKVDGFFYAVQHATTAQISETEYEKFGLAFDKEIIKTMLHSWLNMLHIHGHNIYFELLCNLGFQIINWHDQHTQPSLAAAKDMTKSSVCGGIRQWESLVYGTPSLIREECETAIKATNNKGFILGTGCVTPLTAPRGNIQAAIDTARMNA